MADNPNGKKSRRQGTTVFDAETVVAVNSPSDYHNDKKIDLRSLAGNKDFASALNIDTGFENDDLSDSDAEAAPLMTIPETGGQGDGSAAVGDVKLLEKEKTEQELLMEKEKALEEELKDFKPKDLSEEADNIEMPDCKESLTDCPWPFTRFLWVLGVIAGGTFLGLSEEEDDTPAYDITFAVSFLVITIYIFMQCWNFYTSWRMSCAIKTLFLINYDTRMETKRFTLNNVKLQLSVGGIKESSGELKVNNDKIVALGEKIAGQVNGFNECQEKMRDNIEESFKSCRLSLKNLTVSIALNKKLVSNDISGQNIDIAELLHSAYDDTAGESGSVDEKSYVDLRKKVKDNITSIVDSLRYYPEYQKDLKLPTFAEISQEKEEISKYRFKKGMLAWIAPIQKEITKIKLRKLEKMKRKLLKEYENVKKIAHDMEEVRLARERKKLAELAEKSETKK